MNNNTFTKYKHSFKAGGIFEILLRNKFFYSVIISVSILIITGNNLYAQTGCTSTLAEVVAEFDDQLPPGVSVYTFPIVTETPVGAADPNLFQAEWPVLPPAGYSDFTNALGSTQSDSIFCVTSSGAQAEGPDIVLDVYIPVEARTTCSEVSFTICRVGDFNGPFESVWIVNKELMDIDPTNPEVELACIPGDPTQPDCGGYTFLNCATVNFSGIELEDEFADGVFSIAVVTPGGNISNNQNWEVDPHCSSSNQTGNCFRLIDFSYLNLDPPNIEAMTLPDFCIDSTAIAYATVSGGGPFTYNWSVITGNVVLGPNGADSISITASAGTDYILALTVQNANGYCIDSAIAVGSLGAIAECCPDKVIYTIDNPCPNNFLDLNAAFTTTNAPPGTIATYHTSEPASLANKIDTAFASGTFYVANYDPVWGCFSPCLNQIDVNIDVCCNADASGVFSNFTNY